VKLRFAAVLLVLSLCCAYSTWSICDLLQERPVAIRLGYMPDAGVLRLVSADFQPLIAQLAVTKVMFYYGSLVDERFNRLGDRPEYFQMFKTLEKAIKLDPYNMDPYYFAQATYTWELNRAADVNRLLIHGMKYRDWDPWLPFYAGFNAAFFLKDADAAASYLRRAAEISGNKTYASLASRAYYLQGKTGLAIGFLEVMLENATDEVTRKVYAKRLQAFRAINLIEEARDRYFSELKVAAVNIDELLSAGYLGKLPQEPYGGAFYLDESGNVLTTSNLYEGQSSGEAK
jgi:hypothetical protein